MANTSNFYNGANYGLSYKDDDFLNVNYRTPAGSIGFPTDPRLANQIKAVSEKLNTGAKIIEFSMVSPEVAESIPNQHLEELRRLKKLVGFDFTVHGPLIEPTGATKEGFNEFTRQEAERQMWSAVERSKKLVEKDENVIITFHSSNGLPETETTIIDDRNPNEPKKTQIIVIDERTGNMGKVESKENYLLGDKGDIDVQLEKMNKDNWVKQLSRTSYAAQQGIHPFERAEAEFKELKSEGEMGESGIKELYLNSKTEKGRKEIEQYSEHTKKAVHNIIANLNNGEIYVREAYQDLQDRFNEAYESAKKNPQREEDLKRLESFKKEFQDKVKTTNFDDPKNISELSQEVLKGVNILTDIKTPQIMRPLKDFALDRASDTFGNLAYKSYKEFKDGSPIISIENPPVGSGLNKADELKKLVDMSKQKFVEKATKNLNLSESEAKNQADKLIGVTWDLGHINMLRKYGYGEEELKKQTKTILPVLKHVHLSDNFGMEHTELPMGMGNVPTKAHLDLIDGYNKKIKKIVETGGQWFQSFGNTPFKETLTALGSPIYAMSLGPTWNQAYGSSLASGSAGYFAGLGMNPDIHHSVYGAGFSGLPTELGGQIPGRNSRLSGTAME